MIRLLCSFFVATTACSDGAGDGSVETLGSAESATSPDNGDGTNTPGGTSAPSPTTTVPTTGSTSITGSNWSSGPGGMTGGTMGSPVVSPHWVLRDSSDAPVDAVVSGAHDTFVVTEFGDDSYECVWLSNLGQDPVGVKYELASGDAAPCYDEVAGGWQSGIFYWDEPSCSGPGYALGGSTYVQKVGGEMYAPHGSVANVAGVTMAYRWGVGGQCEAVTLGVAYELWRYKALPAWVLDALPEGPYTIELEY